MVWLTESAFEQFHDTINLSGDFRASANARRDWVVGRLRSGGLTVLDAIAMGSIPRYTALSGHADVDVMAVLHYGEHIKDRNPAQVLQTTKTALGAGAGSIRRNGQAVTVTFQSWPNVDVVPASRISDDGVVTGYKIPDMNRGVWLPTNPPKHGDDIRSAAIAYGSNFRQVIKMLKDWNRRQTIRLQSYHIEVIALEMGAVGWSDHSWPIMKWFEAAQAATSFCWHNGQDVSGYLSWDQANRIKTQLGATERVARQAWHYAYRNDHRLAIPLWKSIFGQRFPSYG